MAIEGWLPLALGFGLGLSLAAPPGPIAILAAERATRRGFLAGLVVALGAMTGDATYAFAMGFGVIKILDGRPLLLPALTLLGSVLMLSFAWSAWKTARRPPTTIGEAAPSKAKRFASLGLLPGGFLSGYALAILSPFNLAWWLGAGTALFTDYGTLIYVGFFAALLTYSFVWAGLFSYSGERVGRLVLRLLHRAPAEGDASAGREGLVRVVSYASAALLLAFALFFLHRGVTRFLLLS